MALYEDRVAENILEEALAFLPEGGNKREGGIVNTALRANAEKLEDVYIDLETANDNLAADKMNRESLIRRAGERGLVPFKATKSVYELTANCAIAVGERFTCAEHSFIVREAITETTFKVECEQAGAETNYYTGIEAEYLGFNENFTHAVLSKLLILGEDEEGTEAFRARYYEDVQNKAFSGNIPAYIQAMNAIDGVGASKVDTSYEEEGVKCLIMAADYSAASEELVERVQQAIDPETDINNWGKEYGLPTLESYKGKGYGLAPIDHSVLIFSVEEVAVDISMQLFYTQGYAWENLREEVTKVIEIYMLELRKSWQKTANITVRASQIISRVIDIEGIEDITDVTVQGNESETLTLSQIPILGVIEVV